MRKVWEWIKKIAKIVWLVLKVILFVIGAAVLIVIVKGKRRKFKNYDVEYEVKKEEAKKLENDLKKLKEKEEEILKKDYSKDLTGDDAKRILEERIKKLRGGGL